MVQRAKQINSPEPNSNPSASYALMLTQLDVIDTFIKVGFGVIITGVTSYAVMRRNHSHELKKVLINDKKELLREFALKMEKSGSLVNAIKLSIYHLVISSAQEKDEKLNELIKELAGAYNEAKEARCLCYMVGDQVLASYMLQFCNLLGELHKHYGKERLAYDYSFVEANGDKRTEVKELILTRLSESFQSIYS